MPPFNLMKWIEDNADKLQPPVANHQFYKEQWENFVIMIVGNVPETTEEWESISPSLGPSKWTGGRPESSSRWSWEVIRMTGPITRRMVCSNRLATFRYKSCTAQTP